MLFHLLPIKSVLIPSRQCSHQSYNVLHWFFCFLPLKRTVSYFCFYPDKSFFDFGVLQYIQNLWQGADQGGIWSYTAQSMLTVRKLFVMIWQIECLLSYIVIASAEMHVTSLFWGEKGNPTIIACVRVTHMLLRSLQILSQNIQMSGEASFWVKHLQPWWVNRELVRSLDVPYASFM